MTDRTCSVDGCDKPFRTKNFCKSHYARFLRTGSVPDTPIRRYGTASCEVPECGRPHCCHGYCSMHYKRLVVFGDLNRAKTMPSGERHWNWAGQDAAYKGVHRRLYSRRGPASSHPCAHCGGPAAQWAYDHEDPNQRFGQIGPSSNRLPYSLDPSHYMPLCVQCHVRFDRDARAA